MPMPIPRPPLAPRPDPAQAGGGARRPRVAIVGGGISGLGAAHALADHADVTLFEAAETFGGHAHTVDVTLDGVTHGVDTGFLVFNHRTYPRLVQLFDALQVPTAPSDMSFSVQNPARGLEWCGSGLGSVFAQRRNLLRPSFWRMLAQVLRFNKLARTLARTGEAEALSEPVGSFLDRHGFGSAFREDYFLPMVGSIWSCPTEQMLDFPVGTMIRFCDNHGLIQIVDRPQWHTVRGGSREYVRRLLQSVPDARAGTPVRAVRRLPPGVGSAGVAVLTDAGTERFDDVVLACHTDQALALLADASALERRVLGAIRYQRNEAVLHTDASVLPSSRRAWAAWNYERTPAGQEQAAVCLHYLINRLQPLPWSRPVIVSLNPARPIDPSQVISRHAWAHPVFDQAAVKAQRELASIQGSAHVWFAGAWAGYGFHEDGLRAGQQVARAMRHVHDARPQGLAA